ncbi:MAG: right-handed parallel beta-helix repeat-containing protein [Bacteroidota bacterium]
MTGNTANSNGDHELHVGNGIRVSGSFHTVNSNTTDLNADYGIWADAGAEVTVNGNTATGNWDAGLYIGGVAGLSNSQINNNVANGNNPSASGTGIKVINSNLNVFQGNTTNQNSTGFTLQSSDGNKILNGESTDNGSLGVKISSSSSTLLAGSAIEGNSEIGVLIDDGSDNTTVWNNTVSDNGDGDGPSGGVVVSLAAGIGHSMSANVFSNNNPTAITIDDNSGLNGNIVVAMNNFVAGGSQEGGVSILNPTTTVMAPHNWWGGSGGPDHSGNSNTTNLGVSASDDVDFNFFKSAPLSLPVAQQGPFVNSAQPGVVYRSLVDALENAESSGSQTIEVRSGGFSEPGYHQISHNDLKVVGVGRDLSYLNFFGGYLSVEADNVEISGLDLDNGQRLDPESGETFGGFSESQAIEVNDYSNTQIKQNRIRGSSDSGIHLSYTSDVVISGNDILWNGSSGVDSYESTGLVIQSNSIFENGDVNQSGPMAGVVLSSGSGAHILENHINHNVNHGIWIGNGSSTALIEQNQIYNNGHHAYFSNSFDNPAGISIPGGDENIIRNNVLSNNVRFGIRLIYGQDNVIEDNTVGTATITTTMGPSTHTPSEPLEIYGIARLQGKSIGTPEETLEKLPRQRSQQKSTIEQRRAERKARLGLVASAAPRAAHRGLKARSAVSPEASTLSSITPRKSRPGLRPGNAYRAPLVTAAGASPTPTLFPGNFSHGIKVEDWYNSILGNIVKDNGRTLTYSDGSFVSAEPAGIDLNDAAYSTVTGNVVNDNHFSGIRFTNSASYNLIESNTINGNGFAASGGGGGVFLKSSSNNNQFFANTLQSNSSGVVLNNASSTMLGGNTINSNTTGLVLSNVTSSSFFGNTVSTNTAEGIVLLSGSQNRFADNTVASNGEHGIRFGSLAGDENVASFNRISGHTAFGVLNESEYTVDARLNWWGHGTGPGGGATDPESSDKTASGSGDHVSNSVVFYPFFGFPPMVTYGQEFLESSDLDPVTMGQTGIILDFSNSGSGGLVVVSFFNMAPPPGPFTDPDNTGLDFTLMARYWEIFAPDLISGFTTDVTFDFEGLSGITDVNGLRLAKRANLSGGGVAWILVPLANTTIDGLNNTITATNQTGFSQWALVQAGQISPTFASVAPNALTDGQANVLVSINGTGFLTGITTVDFGEGIVVHAISVNSSAELVADVSVGPGANPGPRDVVVSNGPGLTVTEASGVTVLPAAATLVSLTPNSGMPGQTLDVTVAGQFFYSGLTTVGFGGGIGVNSVTVNSSSQLTANITVAANAAPGVRDVSVSNDGSTFSTLTNSFTVVSAVPALTAVSPASGSRGESLSVGLTGANFVTGTTTVSFGTDITVDSIKVVSATEITAYVSIDVAASTGPRDIIISNGSTASVTGTGAFTVVNPAPSVTGVSPQLATKGTTIDVEITGAGLISGVSAVSFGNGITVNSLNVGSTVQATASITVDPAASTGARDVTVVNATPGGGTVALSGGFTVVSAVPALTAVAPASGSRGESLSVGLTGANFVTGTTTVSFGTDITVDSIKVVSATEITAYVSIDVAASTGPRDIIISNGSTASVTGTGAFTVVNPAPSVTGVSPQLATKGTTIDVEITGAGLISGVSAVSFGNGITVNSLNVGSTVQATASITVDPAASTGARDVTVVNATPGGGTVALSGGFTVGNVAPTLTGLSPASAIRGSILNVTVTGTGFEAGVTTVSFGDDISVNTLSVTGSGELVATIAIGAIAATGARPVSVTNASPGGGEVSLAGAFTVETGTPSRAETTLDLIPEVFVLHEAYPNPFNPATKIRYAIPEGARVKLEIYNMLGNVVAALVEGEKQKGYYEITWVAENQPSGVYLVRMQAEGLESQKRFIGSRKVVLVK